MGTGSSISRTDVCSTPKATLSYAVVVVGSFLLYLIVFFSCNLLFFAIRFYDTYSN